MSFYILKEHYHWNLSLQLQHNDLATKLPNSLSVGNSLSKLLCIAM